VATRKRAREPTLRSAHYQAVGVDDLELAETDLADRHLDLLEVADDDTGERLRLDRGRGLLEPPF